MSDSNQAIELVKKLRVDIDQLIQETSGRVSAEWTLSHRQLQLAKGWLGKLLGNLGKDTPYKVVNESSEIPATAEVYAAPDSDPKNESLLAQTNRLRETIKFIEADITTFWGDIDLDKRGDKLVEYSIKCLEEAGMWLSFELGRQRDIAQSNQETIA